jgi:hypothetical protein
VTSADCQPEKTAPGRPSACAATVPRCQPSTSRQFDLRWATGESDPAKQADARREAFKRLTLEAMPADFSAWVEGDVEWI